MDKLVDYVKIYVDYIALVQIIRVDYKMPVYVADPHVASCSNEFDSEIVEHLFCLFAKDSLDSLNLVKTLKVISEWVRCYLGVAQYLNFKF